MSKKPFQQRARELSDKALEVLGEIADDECEKASDRVAAAKAILDRGYGAPKQAIIAVPMERQMREAAAALTNDELLAIVNAEFEVISDRPALLAPHDPLMD